MRDQILKAILTSRLHPCCPCPCEGTRSHCRTCEEEEASEDEIENLVAEAASILLEEDLRLEHLREVLRLLEEAADINEDGAWREPIRLVEGLIDEVGTIYLEESSMGSEWTDKDNIYLFGDCLAAVTDRYVMIGVGSGLPVNEEDWNRALDVYTLIRLLEEKGNALFPDLVGSLVVGLDNGCVFVEAERSTCIPFAQAGELLQSGSIEAAQDHEAFWEVLP